MWTEKLVLQFIDLYREKRLLWDQKHPHFYKRVFKERAWDDIAATLNMPAEECRRKMFGLHSSFRREKWKIRRSQTRGSVGEQYVSGWFAFNKMSFLLNKPDFRKTTNKVMKIEPVEHTEYRKRKREDISEKLEPDRYEAPSVKSTDEDISQIFSNLVAKRMRAYSPLVQSAVQQAIMNVFFNADRGYYDEKPSCLSFDPSLPQHYVSVQHSQTSQNRNDTTNSPRTSRRSKSPAKSPDRIEGSPTSDVLLDSPSREEPYLLSDGEEKLV